jgi:hypothetical protein
MKKILTSVVLLTNVLFANIEDDCPRMDIKNITVEQIKESKDILHWLDKHRVTKEVYLDILKAYNRTNYIERYINKETLNKAAELEIWGLLNAYKYLDKEKEYRASINSINANNPEWCKINISQNNEKVF